MPNKPAVSWYQIHVKTTSNALSGIFNPKAQGPFDRDAMLSRVQEILEAKPEPSGQVPHYAQVTRVDVAAGNLFERKPNGWVYLGEVSHLPALPVRVADLPIVNSRERGHLLLSAFDLKDMTARKFVSEGSGAEVEKLLNECGYNRALVMKANLAPYRQVGVDLEVVRDVLRAQPYPDTFPESAAQMYPPEQEMGNVPVVGFRTWRLNICSQILGGEIVDREPRLYGPHYWFDTISMHEWADAEKVAECRRDDHLVPEADCDCGLYALHDLQAAINYSASGPEMSLTTMVRGAVLGSGTVLVHQRGWRSQYAKIIGFDGEHVEERFRPALQRLAAKFEVPILSSERLLQLALKKGRVIRKSDVEGPDLS